MKKKLGLQTRDIAIQKESIDEESRTIEMTFSSEEPYDRGWGVEVLSHKSDHVDLTFLDSGRAQLLVGHNQNDPVGVIEKAWVQEGVGHAQVRFGPSDRAEEIFQDIQAGIRSNVSVGYHIKSMSLMEKSDGKDTYLVDNWFPVEASVVSVPADISVGFRGADDIETEIKGKEEPKEVDMSEKTKEEKKPVVDMESIRRAERARQSDILAIGKMADMEKEAGEAVNTEESVDSFRERAFKKMTEKKPEPVVEDQGIGMSKKEVKRFSFLNLIRGMADNWRGAEFERDCAFAYMDKVEKESGRKARGVLIPPDMFQAGAFMNEELAREAENLSRRDLLTNIGSQGGYLVAEDLLTGSFIDMLRNSAMVMQAGAQTITGLVGDIDIPKQTGGATAYWVGEGDDLTESQQALGQIRMTPKTVGCLTDVTRRMMLQSSVSVEAFIRMDFAKQIGLKVDLGAISGTGASGEPRGILETSGIGSVTLNATSAPDWGDLVDLETAVATDNALMGSLAYMTNATIVGNMKQTAKDSGSGLFLMEGGSTNGYPVYRTGQMPAKYMIFGNWSDLIMAFWSGLDITIDKTTLGASGGTRVTAFQDMDIAVRHAESFAKGYKA